MNDDLAEKFARFAQDRLRPAVGVVEARKRRGLRLALAVALAVFVGVALVVYLMFAPYLKLMNEHEITYWPMLLVVPASLAMLAFCIVYILGLRGAVVEFRTTLVRRIGEFIDPALAHEANVPFAPDVLSKSLLFVDGDAPGAGGDRFRGRIAGADVSLAELRSNAGKGGAGVFCAAVFPRDFGGALVLLPASAAGVPGVVDKVGEAGGGGKALLLDDAGPGCRAVVPALREQWAREVLSDSLRDDMREIERLGFDVRVSCRGDTLFIALLAPAGKERKGALDEFDMEGVMGFCRGAGVCLDMVRAAERNAALWRQSCGK